MPTDSGTWNYNLVEQNSVESNVIGLTDSVISIVPKKELLMAMKLHSGRDADLRDVVMLAQGADWEAVAEFATVGDMSKVASQLDIAIKTISKKEFRSSLRAEFGLRSDPTLLIKKTVDGLHKIKKLIGST